MLKQLDRLYFNMSHTNTINSCARFCIRVLANWWAKYLMPINTNNNKIDKDTVIVSLTSFPERIDSIWITIASLLNQDYQNLHIVLWLSKLQFNSIDKLPIKLLRLQEKGLDIQFVDDDLRPHKKYYYSIQKYPDNHIITVDDDIIYTPCLISTLVNMHIHYPECVICNRGIEIGKVSYSLWKHPNRINEPVSNIMPTGIGGVFYPAHIFDGTQILQAGIIKETCLHGDDLWLNFWTRYTNHKIVFTGLNTGLITILSSQKSALCTANVGENRNDIQIRKLDMWANCSCGVGFYVNV